MKPIDRSNPSRSHETTPKGPVLPSAELFKNFQTLAADIVSSPVPRDPIPAQSPSSLSGEKKPPLNTTPTEPRAPVEGLTPTTPLSSAIPTCQVPTMRSKRKIARRPDPSPDADASCTTLVKQAPSCAQDRANQFFSLISSGKIANWSDFKTINLQVKKFVVFDTIFASLEKEYPSYKKDCASIIKWIKMPPDQQARKINQIRPIIERRNDYLFGEKNKKNEGPRKIFFKTIFNLARDLVSPEIDGDKAHIQVENILTQWGVPISKLGPEFSFYWGQGGYIVHKWRHIFSKILDEKVLSDAKAIINLDPTESAIFDATDIKLDLIKSVNFEHTDIGKLDRLLNDSREKTSSDWRSLHQLDSTTVTMLNNFAGQYVEEKNKLDKDPKNKRALEQKNKLKKEIEQALGARAFVVLNKVVRWGELMIRHSPDITEGGRNNALIEFLNCLDLPFNLTKPSFIKFFTEKH